jgi:hypothetical protein
MLSWIFLLSLLPLAAKEAFAAASSADKNCTSTSFHLSDPPYENYFYSNCNTSAQVVVTSPLSDSNLTLIGPRFLVSEKEYLWQNCELISARLPGQVVTAELLHTSPLKMASMAL